MQKNTIKKQINSSEFAIELSTSKIKNQNKKIIILSVIGGAVVMLLGLQVFAMTGDATLRDSIMVGGMLVCFIPYTMQRQRHEKRLESIDGNLPPLLQSLVSSVQSGGSLLTALEQTADHKLGALTPELKNFRANISWGMPLEDAFEYLRYKVQTNLARRVFTLLETSVNVGGDLISSLKVIQTHVTDYKNIEKERKASLGPYVYIIYISFLVFLIIAVLLVSQFFGEIRAVQEGLADSGNLGMFSALMDLDVDHIKSILFQMSLIEALFGGLAAGKIGSGTFFAGTKHVVIMIVMATVAFIVL